MKKKLLASLAAVLVAGGTLVGTATVSSAASVSPCTSSKSIGSGSTLRFVPARNNSTNCYLAQKNQGNGVWALQMALKNCNYRYSLATDGIFGSGTKSTLKKFQTAKRIESDGVYGSQTRGKMSFYGGFMSTGAICNKA